MSDDHPTPPRLFLVAPAGLTTEHILACTKAACGAADVASIVVPAAVVKIAHDLQALDLAVLCNGQAKPPCDGVHINADADMAALRKAVGKTGIVGVYCAASRHAAMQAAEAGADYIAFAQKSFQRREPIVGWWAELFEIPCVAFDPSEIKDLDILLPQCPDFIRPSDAMWASPEEAARVSAEFMQRITA